MHNRRRYMSVIEAWPLPGTGMKTAADRTPDMNTTQTKTKPQKALPPPEATFEAFNFKVPTFDVPASFREFAEKSIAQARETYAKMKSAAEDATDMVEDSYETAREGVFSLGVKALDAVKTNSDASFALARDLFGAKTFAEVIELQTSFARKQFDAVTAQVREFQELTQKMVSQTAKPVADKVEKAFEGFKAA
jgi:phasin